MASLVLSWKESNLVSNFFDEQLTEILVLHTLSFPGDHKDH